MKELTKKNLECNLSEEEYLLMCLGEESAEIIKAVSKAFRFGIRHDYPDIDMTNRENIEYEIHDFMAVIEMLQKKRSIMIIIDREKIEKKKAKINKYMKLTGVVK